MRTNDLIDAIAADAATPPKRLTPAFWAGLGVSAVGAWIASTMTMDPRPDIAAALETVRFPLKFVLTSAFGIAAAALAMRLARPGVGAGPARVAIMVAFAMLAVAVGTELLVVPSDAWAARLVGQNWLVCLIHLPLFSAIPLAAILIAMRRGAPSSPTRLGAAAGLLAGAVGATFYAAHCPDDSPLFVAVWYTLAVGMVTLVGAALGTRFLKW